jgi:hypothetical protein
MDKLRICQVRREQEEDHSPWLAREDGLNTTFINIYPCDLYYW